MEGNIEFNIQDQIDNWVIKIKTELSITEIDSEELKSHLLDSIDQLKDTGLNEEESFLIASRRLGTIVDWEEDYNQVNNPVIQMRRSILILAGVLVYFLLYYFIGFTSRLLIIGLLSKDLEAYMVVNVVSWYLISMHLIIILFFLNLYFFDKKIISWIENFKLQPKHTILLLLTAFIFGILNTCLLPVVKNIIGESYDLRSSIVHVYIYFDYSFPFIICFWFILIYYKYYKITKF